MIFDSKIFSIGICVYNFKENPFLCLAVANEPRNIRDNSFAGNEIISSRITLPVDPEFAKA